MIRKTDPDIIESFRRDHSNLLGSVPVYTAFPENADDVQSLLLEHHAANIPTTIAGAGTGITGARVPCDGAVMAMDKMNAIRSLDVSGRRMTVQPGVTINEIMNYAGQHGLTYPPAPTERTAYIGGNVATNASGAYSFRYGPTRTWVQALHLYLADGSACTIRRGEILADVNGFLDFTADGNTYHVPIPTYTMPNCKHTAGYYARPHMDLIDLFIGSEGTLGVITEIEIALIPAFHNRCGGIIFFDRECDALSCAYAVRTKTLSPTPDRIDALLLEFWEQHALDFLRKRYAHIPDTAAAAVYFEQNNGSDAVIDAWANLIEHHNAHSSHCWFATSDRELETLREFRHALPELVNEAISKRGYIKLGTDFAVPDTALADIIAASHRIPRSTGVEYHFHGHLSENNMHVNFIPKNDDENKRAQKGYIELAREALRLGGTIAAEHGIGKIKRHLLYEMFGEKGIHEMLTIKRMLDPKLLLGRGTLFESYE